MEDRESEVSRDSGVATVEPEPATPGHVSRRRALMLGSAAALTGALSAVLAACGTKSAAASNTGGTGGGGTGSSSPVAPAAKATAPSVGGYSGPTAPSTIQTTLNVTSASAAPAPQLAAPAQLIKNGQINAAYAYSSGAIGYLAGSLGLAAWSQRYPQVTFNVSQSLFSGSGGGLVPLLTELAGGTAPDVFPAYGDVVAPYVQQNAVADITQLTNAWPEFQGILPSVKNQMVVGGKVYGIPWEAPSGYVMVYRKDLFDQAKVSYPTSTWTIDDYVSKATAISKALGPKVYGTNILWQYTNWYFAEFAQMQGVPWPQYFFYIPNTTGDGFGMAPASEIARALTFYQTLVKNKAALYGSSETLATLNSDLPDGRCAMTLRQTKQIGGSFLSNIGQSGFVQPDVIGLVAVPQGPEGLRNYDLRSTPMCLNASLSGDKLNLAFEFMKDMNGPRGAALSLAISGLQNSVPQYPSPYPGTAFPEWMLDVFPKSWIDVLNSNLCLNIPLPPAPSAYGIPGSMPTGSASGTDSFIQQILTNTSADPLTVATQCKQHIEGTVLNTPVAGCNKTNWHAYYKALGAYFQANYPTYYKGTYTKYYKQYETF